MSLKQLTGAPLSTPIATFALAGGNSNKLTTVPWIKQEQTQWCWAAVMQMAFSHNNVQINQCSLSNLAFECTGCCSTPSSSLCNIALPIFLVEREWSRHTFDAQRIDSSVDFDSLKFEVDAGRPVEIGLKWDGGGGHAVLVIGWEFVNGQPHVHVHDPWRGELFVTFDGLKAAYGEGRWNWSWTGIKKR